MASPLMRSMWGLVRYCPTPLWLEGHPSTILPTSPFSSLSALSPLQRPSVPLAAPSHSSAFIWRTKNIQQTSRWASLSVAMAASGLREFTPVMTARYPNIVDAHFTDAMTSISADLKKIFSADSVVLLPGSGTFAMEAVARQFCTNKRVLVLIDGYFGYRWKEIFTQGSISSHVETLQGEPLGSVNGLLSYGPPPIQKVIETINQMKPEVLIMTHTDTSTGINLPLDYISAVSAAAHNVGAISVLDCIASGSIWTDMKALNLDIIVTAPQKAFSAPAAVGIVLLNSATRKKLDETASTSFSLDLRKWVNVMEQYEARSFVYHTTLPTASIEQLRGALNEIMAIGPEKLQAFQTKLGESTRQTLESRNLVSAAGSEFKSSTVLVYYCDDPVAAVGRFKAEGFKMAGGFFFFLGEKEKPKTFRIGLFGLDKLQNVDATIEQLNAVIAKVFPL